MNLRFGNLTVEQFAKAVGADFTEEEMAILESHRTNRADFTDEDKFHIFDDPAVSIVIGAEAIKSALPIFNLANKRRLFTREVGFYPARTTEPEGEN